MTRKEYRLCLKLELYKNESKGFLTKIRIKYFQPNTNFVYLCRKMWHKAEKGGKIRILQAQFLYLKIFRKYGCCVERAAHVGAGFSVSHPVGIVIGHCTIGKNFRMYQNCTVGVQHEGDAKRGLNPQIGNNVKLYNGSMILGNVSICDNVTIGANSLCIRDITEEGVYVGNPVKKIKDHEGD